MSKLAKPTVANADEHTVISSVTHTRTHSVSDGTQLLNPLFLQKTNKRNAR